MVTKARSILRKLTSWRQTRAQTHVDSSCGPINPGIPVTHFITVLPYELILLIVEALPRWRDLNSLLRCNRQHYSLLNQVLYKLDARARNEAIWWAVRTADVDLARRAIDAGSDPNKMCIFGVWSDDYLLHAAVLLSAHARKNTTMLKGRLSGFLERNDNVIRYLVSQGADIYNLDNPQRSPLVCAVSNGDINSVRLFLDKGADVSMKKCMGGSLVESVISQILSNDPDSPTFLAIFKLLLDHGLDPNDGDNFGRTPLCHLVGHLGASMDKTRTRKYRNVKDERVKAAFKALIEHGADINVRDESGVTPLSCALEFVQDEPICFKLLLQYGVDTSLVRLPSDPVMLKAALKVCEEVSRATGRTFKFQTD
ncbi:hypothetical protein FQN49_005057 [Arthroderma sp. PD_2]|nr:hypothetical protein FQN49_005057 [Arthroderma sp. PD_2]